MPKPEKVEKVKELQNMIKDVPYIFFADYKGMAVKEIQELRNKLREKGSTFTVVKNTLTTIAFRNIGKEQVEKFLKGPTALIMVKDDIGATLKTVLNFDKEKNLPVIKGGILEDQLVEKEQIKALSELPSRDVLLAQLVGVLQSPIRGLVTVLNGPIRGLVIALNQIKEAKAK